MCADVGNREGGECVEPWEREGATMAEWAGPDWVSGDPGGFDGGGVDASDDGDAEGRVGSGWGVLDYLDAAGGDGFDTNGDGSIDTVVFGGSAEDGGTTVLADLDGDSAADRVTMIDGSGDFIAWESADDRWVMRERGSL